MFTLIPTIAAATIFAFLPLPDSGGGKQGPDPLIQDRAGFFSAEAKAEALQAIAKLQRDKQVEVRVETFQSLPSDKSADVGEMSSQQRAEFFAGWLKELARERHAKGVLILICKDPSHLRVGISKELYRRGFRDDQRDAISQRLLSGFREKDYDRGLTDAIAYIRTTADRSSAAGAAGAVAVPGSDRTVRRREAGRAQENVGIGSGIGGLLCVGLVGFALVMVVMSVIRMFRRPAMQPGYGQYGQPMPGQAGYGQFPGQYPGAGGGYGAPAGGWGGGMLGGLMSGLGGALLGNYMYDRWNSPGSQGGHAPMDPGSAGPMYDDSNRYQDFTSSGGDFGDSAGGDFGGGDFGGGDMGGGDGGGDF